MKAVPALGLAALVAELPSLSSCCSEALSCLSAFLPALPSLLISKATGRQPPNLRGGGVGWK